MGQAQLLEDTQHSRSGAGTCSVSGVLLVTHPSVGNSEWSAVMHHREGWRAGHQIIEQHIVKQNTGFITTFGRKFCLQMVKNEQLISQVVTWKIVTDRELTVFQMKTAC